ncbi:helicase associated domain-containing protein [Mycolicibacterium canariasense]|uniref:helicase associated domain-containing protein n=1 Tax=Mycolicibacterium canariasense TaxID=228230 RepID=UPI003908AE9F
MTAEGFRLGQWICNQRTAFRSGALSTERKVRLEALPRWSWAVLAGQWEHGLDEAREFGRMHGHTCVPGDHITGESFRLGKWVRRQRSTYRAGKLSADRVARLEALPGWVWDARA